MTSASGPALPGIPGPKTARGERTRSRLLKAAATAFGTRGFFGAGIADITGQAGVAQGTFYCYFRNKEDVMRELVRQMGLDIRKHLSTRIAGATDRLDAEERGLHAFLDYVARHQHLYRILQEAQFVDESIYRDYYEAFGASYMRLLTRAQGRGELRPGDNQVRVWALMGMAHMLGMRFAVWDRDLPLEQIVAEAADLLRNGLAPGRSA